MLSRAWMDTDIVQWNSIVSVMFRVEGIGLDSIRSIVRIVLERISSSTKLIYNNDANRLKSCGLIRSGLGRECEEKAKSQESNSHRKEREREREYSTTHHQPTQKRKDTKEKGTPERRREERRIVRVGE